MIDVASIKLRSQTLSPVPDERARRQFAASEALAAGRGSIAAVSEATGIARSTIGRGLDEQRGKALDTAQGDPPPLKWSALKYGFEPTRGWTNAEEDAQA